MAVAEPIAQPKPHSAPPVNHRWSGYTHLLAARMKELKREPEVIFWVFVFPLLLALGLGIAFRNKPADVTSIAIASGPTAGQTLALIQHSPRIRTTVLDQAQAEQAFHLGKYDLVVEPGAPGNIQYLFDPARPESVLSRAEVNDGLIEYVRWGPIGRVGLIRNLPTLYDGTHIAHPLAERQAAKRIEFSLDEPVDVMVDGEVMSLQCQTLDVLPSALDVVV